MALSGTAAIPLLLPGLVAAVAALRAHPAGVDVRVAPLAARDPLVVDLVVSTIPAQAQVAGSSSSPSMIFSTST